VWFGIACVCVLLAVGGVMTVAPAAGEAVPAVLVADAATVGLWSFQEGQGARVACATRAPAGTLHGAIWVPGREGYAVSTRSGYVTIPDDPAIRPASALTVEAWVKLAQSGGDLVCKNGAYMLRLGGSMQGYFHIGGEWRVVQGQRPVPTGQWCHLAMTYDSRSRTAALYLDGVLDARQAIGDLPTGLLDQGTEELRLGTNNWRPVGSFVDGKIAALRISNVARAFVPSPAAGPKQEALPAGNLVPNGDFELGLLGWRIGSEGDARLSWAPDARHPAHGRLCLQGLPNTGEALLSRPFPVHKGTRYVLSARVRCEAPGRQATIGAWAAGSPPEAWDAPFRQSVDLTPEWQEVSKTFALPGDWTAPSVYVRIDRPWGEPFWVDDVRLVAEGTSSGPTLKDSIGVSASVTQVGHLFFADQPAELPLEVVNSDAGSHRVSVRARVVDWEGRELLPKAVGTFEVAAGSSKQAPFRLDTSRRGAFRLSFDLAAEGETWRQGADLKYAVVVPLKGRGDAEASAFGMNTHMEREATPNLARNLEVLSECGVKWIRGWWGWGMSEKERGQFDWSEYDRQLATVEGAGMRLMPILLRYYPSLEQAWAGPTDEIQRPPYKMEEWSAFVRQVVGRYRGRISAWEVWNEPEMSGPDWTPELYASLLRATSAPIREVDPKAAIVGFAGVEPPYMASTLAFGVGPTMDVVSEHSYSQLGQPEAQLPPRTETVRAVLAAHGGDKPIWHTEQGVSADDDGYLAPSLSEADAAALYTRNLVVARSLDIGKYFWFSAQTSPTYGMAVFYEDYIPRPRLVALNACASFLEGTAYRRAFRPSRNCYVFLFQGTGPVAVVWNLDDPARLHLPVSAEQLEAFDLMGNPMPVLVEGARTRVDLPANRPTYLRLRAGESGALEQALSKAEVSEVPPVAITARAGAAGRVEVTVTNRSQQAQDGVVELLPSAGAAPEGWAVPQHFHSLAPAETRSFRLALPARGAGGVRVRVGDSGMREVTAQIAGG
jgi:hypothetical protein